MILIVQVPVVLYVIINVEIVQDLLPVVTHALMLTDPDLLVFAIMVITMLELMQLAYPANILV